MYFLLHDGLDMSFKKHSGLLDHRSFLLLHHLQLYTRSLVLAHLLSDLYHKRTTFEWIGTTILEDITHDVAVSVGVAVFGFVAHVCTHGLGTTKSRAFAD